jgi:hypothetical protein
MDKLSPEEAVRRLKDDPGSLFLDLEGVMIATKLKPRQLLDELSSGRLKAISEGSYDSPQAMWNGARVSGLELLAWMVRRAAEAS